MRSGTQRTITRLLCSSRVAARARQVAQIGGHIFYKMKPGAGACAFERGALIAPKLSG